MWHGPPLALRDAIAGVLLLADGPGNFGAAGEHRHKWLAIGII
jgi:hypothetical protein